MGVLGLLLGCWVLGAWGTSSPPPKLSPEEGLWVELGGFFSLKCEGPCGSFALLGGGGGGAAPLAVVRGPFALFARGPATPHDAAEFSCRCQRDPPSPPQPATGPPPTPTASPAPPSPSSNRVPVVLKDPKLPPPKLRLPLPQPVPVPRGGNVTLVCEGPEVSGTFQLYHRGPKWLVEQKEVSGGGNVTFNLGPLQPPDEGPYVCTYRPNGSAMGSAPSPLLLLPVEGDEAVPHDTNWPGCEYWTVRP